MRRLGLIVRLARPMSRAGRVRLAGLLIPALTLAAACDDLFVSPSSPIASTIALSFSVSAARAGDAQAFDRVDAARIVLRRDDGTLVFDQTLDLAATGGDRQASIVLESTQESENLDISARLAAAGQPLFDGAGTVTVRQGQSASAEVALQPVVSAVQLSPSNLTLTAIGQSVPVTAAAVYATGDTGRSVIPQITSLNPAVATVAGGMVTSRGEGTTQLVARAGLVSTVAEVRVEAVVASVVVSPAAATVAIGDAEQLTAVVRDANGNPLNRVPQWTTSDASIASVDGNGLVRGLAPGQASIGATAGSITGHATITVAYDSIASVTVFPTAARLSIGQTVQFNAQLRTKSGQLVSRLVQWTTSNALVVTVGTAGLATARGAGSAYIIAEAEGVRDSAQVTVDPPIRATIDLVAGTPVVTPPSPTNLQQVSIEAVISNTGNAPSGAFEWRLLVGTVVTGGTASVPAGGSVRVSAGPFGPYGIGAYTVRLDVDYTNAIAETNENNNSASTTLVVGQAPFVDLVAGRPSITPPNPTSAQAVSIDAAISNTGNSASGTFAWRLRVGTIIVNSGTASLAAGASTKVTAGPLGPYAAGSYTATLDVDFLNAVAESNESNNTASAAFSVSRAGPPVVVTEPAEDVTTASATLVGTVSGDGRPYTMWFEWSTDRTLATFTTTGVGVVDPATNPGCLSIDCDWRVGISFPAISGGKFYYRVVANNADGTSRGSIVAFATPFAAPVVVTEAAENVTDSTATLVGTVMSDSQPYNMWFEWGLDPALGTYNSTGIGVVNATSNSFCLTTNCTWRVGILFSSTYVKYYYRVVASNSAGLTRGAIESFITNSSPSGTSGATTTSAAQQIPGIPWAVREIAPAAQPPSVARPIPRATPGSSANR